MIVIYTVYSLDGSKYKLMTKLSFSYNLYQLWTLGKPINASHYGKTFFVGTYQINTDLVFKLQSTNETNYLYTI